MDTQTVDTVTKFVTNVGLPTAIAVYLVRWVTNSLNGKLDRLATSMDRLAGKIDELSNRD